MDRWKQRLVDFLIRIEKKYGFTEEEASELASILYDYDEAYLWLVTDLLMEEECWRDNHGS